MNQNEVYLQKLTYIKYLWLQAEEQALQPEPFCGYALLSMQDAIEMFLITGNLKYDTTYNPDKKGNNSFVDIFEALEKKISDTTGMNLTQKATIITVNKARVSMKHYVQFPNLITLKEYLVHARTFFIENTPTVFGYSFDSVTLSDLILNDSVREHIKMAEEYMELGKYSESVRESAFGLSKLLRNFDQDSKGESGFMNTISDLESIMRGVKISPEYITHGSGSSREMNCTKSLAKQTNNFLDRTKKLAIEMDKFIRLSAIGVSYGKYSRFNMIAPLVSSWNIREEVYQNPNIILTNFSTQFCISFVVDCALKSQSFYGSNVVSYKPDNDF